MCNTWSTFETSRYNVWNTCLKANETLGTTLAKTHEKYLKTIANIYNILIKHLQHMCEKYICRCLETGGGLGRATSEFISARLGPDGVQSRHKGIYWFKQEWSYVQWILLLLVLPCTGVLVVGVTSSRERKRISCLYGEVCMRVLSLCSVYVLFLTSLFSDVAPASSFIVSKGGSGYIWGKKVKWKKDERQRQKRWPRAWQPSSLSGVSRFPYSAEM
jgi:hypothetical protein